MARILVALGGNALLRRGERLGMDAQHANARIAARAIATIAPGNELIVTHGNGPQIGWLALQSHAFDPATPVPLDVLGAESEGMIGYLLEQELRNALPSDTKIATLLTMVEADPAAPEFAHPTKFIGPLYDQATAEQLTQERGWALRQDGTAWRRVVPSPPPLRVLQSDAIGQLLSSGHIVIAAGGGGIPVSRNAEGHWQGTEAVIDKDHCSALLAETLVADALLLATDVPAVFLDWNQPTQRSIGRTTPADLARHNFPAGSMGPKVAAACNFATRTGNPAVIGALADLSCMLRGEAGTLIQPTAREATP